MNVVLAPEHFIEVPFIQYRNNELVLYVAVVEGRQRVRVYILDDENYQRFTRGEKYTHYGPGPVDEAEIQDVLPVQGRWHIVIENLLQSPIAVEYEVRSLRSRQALRRRFR